MLSHYLKNHVGHFWNDVICEQPLIWFDNSWVKTSGVWITSSLYIFLAINTWLALTLRMTAWQLGPIQQCTCVHVTSWSEPTTNNTYDLTFDPQYFIFVTFTRHATLIIQWTREKIYFISLTLPNTCITMFSLLTPIVKTQCINKSHSLYDNNYYKWLYSSEPKPCQKTVIHF